MLKIPSIYSRPYLKGATGIAPLWGFGFPFQEKVAAPMFLQSWPMVDFMLQGLEELEDVAQRLKLKRGTPSHITGLFRGLGAN